MHHALITFGVFRIEAIIKKKAFLINGRLSIYLKSNY